MIRFLERCYVNFIVFKNESSALMGRVSVFVLSGGLNLIRFSVYLNQLQEFPFKKHNGGKSTPQNYY